MENRMLMWLFKGFDGLLGMVEETVDLTPKMTSQVREEAWKLKERLDSIIKKIMEKDNASNTRP